MSSAEIVDSARFSGGRYNFSQMCTLLSQYVKEKGSFGDLKLGLNCSLDTKGSTAETKNLLPMIEKSVPGSGSGNLNVPPTFIPQKKSDLSAQMTIFYAGQVIVFDNFPADKANDIMNLASKSTTVQITPLHAAQIPAESGTGVHHIFPTNFGIQERRTHCSAQPPLDSGLPIARKNSLARFLEKRKERHEYPKVTANAPYQAPKPAKPASGEAWLGLAPEFPLQIQRH
ncbi:protein tify 10a [Phtheirospermum japonicum]|uniref:Protein TIFY n=1 Tax=Phtheirospermum japonicum TaxID=374723 RepID=A0A830D1T5_9LAMI|nr:protein tify 10a [Phtheirospermum japonicum]